MEPLGPVLSKLYAYSGENPLISKVLNVKTFYNLGDLEKKVNVKLMTCNNMYGYSASYDPMMSGLSLCHPCI